MESTMPDSNSQSAIGSSNLATAKAASPCYERRLNKCFLHDSIPTMLLQMPGIDLTNAWVSKRGVKKKGSPHTRNHSHQEPALQQNHSMLYLAISSLLFLSK
jgi:hypothetical protein